MLERQIFPPLKKYVKNLQTRRPKPPNAPIHFIDRGVLACHCALHMQAIGYLRFSSEEQADGHSVERQNANITAYCQRNNLQLAATIIDEGLSAFKGHHIANGNLGKFLAEVDKGQHRGKALIVEHLDRLSRLGISETSDLLKRLIKAGVEVHITQENRVVRSADDLLTAIMNVIGAYSGQEYSKKLKERVSGAWTKKKHHSENGRAITSVLPSWLYAKTGEPIQVNEERAKVVRRIFEMSANGLGKRMIARRLTEAGVQTFGKSERWAISSIGDILTNRAVIGEYQPQTGKRADRRPEGEVRVGFYPAVVPDGLWQKAQDRLSDRRSGNSSGRTGKVRNLFSGLVYDAETGAPLHYIDKGTRSTRNLSTEKTCSEKPRTIDYASFEHAFLTFLDQLDWKSVLDVSESAEIQESEDRAGSLKIEIQRTEEQIARVTDLLIDTPSQALKDRLIKLEAQLDSDRQSLKAAESKLENVRRKHNNLLDDSIAFEKLSKAQDVETRAKLRQEIARKVKRIECHFDAAGKKGAILCVIRFVNGAKRGIVFHGQYLTVLGPEDARFSGFASGSGAGHFLR